MAEKKLSERVIACHLISLGVPQKEVAQKLNIAEKTVGHWVSSWRQSDKKTLEIIENLKNTLLDLSKDKNTPKYEIMNISTSIKKLHDTLIVKPLLTIEDVHKKNRTV